MKTLRRSVALVASALLVAACAGSGSGSTQTPAATTVPTPAASVAAPSAAVTAAPVATADLDHPVGVIAIGHSGLTGEGTAAQFKPQYSASWATGDAPNVNSIYLRMVAALPATEGHVANNAVGGAKASSLAGQATRALTSVPAPALAIIQTVDNDILCDGSNVAAVGQYVADALARIHDASPNTKILVAGQLGRPNVDLVESFAASNPGAKAFFTWDDECSFYDAGGTVQPAGFKKLSDVIDAYEAETARVCAAVPGCSTDGGLRKAWVDKIEWFAPDYAHLNLAGQKAEAENTWPAVKKLLGL